MTQSAIIPDQLHIVLERFVVGVLKEQPDDVVAFACAYFQREYARRQDASVMKACCKAPLSRRRTESVSSNPDEPCAPPPRDRSQRGRRQAVAAESYDPAEQIDLEQIANYPKTDEELSCLQSAVQDIVLFKSCESDQLRVVLGAMFQREVTPGEIVIRQGDDGDNFYVVQEGVFGVLIHGKRIACFDNKGSFGELALMYNCPRAATIIAECKGILWCLDQMTFRKILVSASATRRKKFEDLLESVPVLSKLKPYERMNLADALENRQFNDGDQIIKQDDAAHEMYFVVNGQVKIVVNESKTGSPEQEVAKANSGQYFGELALVMNTPRTASVYAVGSCTCAVLDVAAFERLLGPCVEIMKRNLDVYEHERKVLGLATIQ